MDKVIKNACRDILAGREPDRNIPLLLNHMADSCYMYSAVRLAIHYYTFYEIYLDEESRWDTEENPLYSQLNKIIAYGIVGTSCRNGRDFEAVAQDMDKLRTAVMERMKLLTAYTDFFRLHEYVQNRVEGRFRDMPVPEDDRDFTRRVMSFIFSSQDNVIINDRIRDVISELPMRLTRQKYFDLLRDCILEYLGSQENSLDSFLYQVRSVAAPDINDAFAANYPQLYELKEFLRGLDYRTIDAETYLQAEGRLKEASAMLEAEISHYYILEEMVNEAYAMLICSPYAGVASQGRLQKEEAVRRIIESTNTSFLSGKREEHPPELISGLSLIEGLQEELSMELMMTEEALYYIDSNFRTLAEGIMADKLLNVLLLSWNLLSESLFIDLDGEKSSRTVDRAMAEKKVQDIIKELSGHFEGQDRMIVRAAMANTLSIIPVIFKSRTDIMEYFLYSLDKCRDVAEKSASMKIIGDMMSQ